MFWNRKNRARQTAPQPESRVLPLPCPLHGAVLVSEPRERGEWAFYCPVCRLATQLVEQHTEPLKPGAVLHAQNAKKRFVEKLQRAKNGRLVVLPGSPGNSRPQTTDALQFANLPTSGEVPRVKKHVG